VLQGAGKPIRLDPFGLAGVNQYLHIAPSQAAKARRHFAH
jgi:hypothetical protein